VSEYIHCTQLFLSLNILPLFFVPEFLSVAYRQNGSTDFDDNILSQLRLCGLLVHLDFRIHIDCFASVTSNDQTALLRGRIGGGGCNLPKYVFVA
jgi:hypothetical protein